MLRINSKKALENIQNYIIREFDNTEYSNNAVSCFSDIAKEIYEVFQAEKYYNDNYANYYHISELEQFNMWCKGLPSIIDCEFIYNGTSIEVLSVILEQSRLQRYKDTESAENKLIEMIYNAIIKAVK